MSKSALSEHFLQHFFYSQEPLAVIGDRLYTLSRSNGNLNGHDAFHVLGKAYVLEESEEVAQLESGLFLAQRQSIERAMTQYVQRNFIDKIQSAAADIQRMQNIYESMQDTSIERFIMVDVFNEYNHEDRGVVDDKVRVYTQEDIPGMENRPSVSDLYSRQNSLGTLVNAVGFVTLANTCYALFQNGGRREEDKGYVIFRGKPLDLKPWIKLDELCNAYTKKLVERINSKAAKHGKQFAGILAEMNNARQTLNSGIKQGSMAAGKTQARRGEVGFRKLREGEYEVSVTIPPYIIEKDGEYHAFTSVKLGMIVKSRNNQIMIDDPPFVLSSSYSHPFVWDDNKICYGGLNWENSRGVRFNHWYGLSNRKGVAKRVAEAIREGKKTMERGYVGQAINPVRHISSCNCRIADNRTGAERYAKQHGIKLERIIKND